MKSNNKIRYLSWQTITLIIIAILVLSCIIYCSYQYYEDFNNSMLDLGNISQAIWNVSQGNSLVYTAFRGQNNRLNGHAELIYYLFSPVYKLIPNPLTLITIQAILFILGAVPVYRLANRHLRNETFSLLLSMCYLLYPVALTGVFFDFHGDTLAMPLLLFVMDAADREDHIGYVIFGVLALACKSYALIPMALMSLLFWIDGKRKFFIYNIVLIIVWEILFISGRHFLVDQNITNPIAGLSSWSIEKYFQVSLSSLFQTAPERLLNGLIAIFPGLLIGLFAAKKIIPAFLMLIPVLLSSGPGPVYRYTTHHYGFLVPFIIYGMVFGASYLKNGTSWISKIVGEQENRWKVYLIIAFIAVLIFDVVFLPLPFTVISRINPDVAENVIIDNRDYMKKDWLQKNVPDKAPIMSDTFLASHLINREVLYRTTYLDKKPVLTKDDAKGLFKRVDNLVFDIFSPYGNYDLNVKKEALVNPDYSLINARDGLLLFNTGDKGLYQDIILDNGDYKERRERFDSGISLVESNIKQVSNSKYRLVLVWVKDDEIDDEINLVVISRIEGIDHSRIVHLPGLLINPIADWEVDILMKEVIEFEIPELDYQNDQYELYTGLYDHSNGFSTDINSRLGEEILLGSIIVGE